MSSTNSVTLRFGYTNTSETRDYKFEDVDDSALASVKTKVKAINESLAGGTDAGLGNFFRSDDYDDTDSENVVGKFNRITEAKYEQVTTEAIPL